MKGIARKMNFIYYLNKNTYQRLLEHRWAPPPRQQLHPLGNLIQPSLISLTFTPSKDAAAAPEYAGLCLRRENSWKKGRSRAKVLLRCLRARARAPTFVYKKVFDKISTPKKKKNREKFELNLRTRVYFHGWQRQLWNFLKWNKY